MLTVLSKSWSITKIQQKLIASNYITAKKLVVEEQTLSSPNVKSGKVLLPATM
jgi:hypothetical protein